MSAIEVRLPGSPPFPTISKLAEFSFTMVIRSSINRPEGAFLRTTIRQDVSSILKVSVSMVFVSTAAGNEQSISCNEVDLFVDILITMD